MTEEPDEGNLQVRVCGGSAGQPVLLPGSPYGLNSSFRATAPRLRIEGFENADRRAPGKKPAASRRNNQSCTGIMVSASTK